MSTAPARRSYPAAWVLGVLGVLLLYFLSYPIVEWSIFYPTSSLSPGLSPALVDAYAAPCERIEFHSPLSRVFTADDVWWSDHLR